MILVIVHLSLYFLVDPYSLFVNRVYLLAFWLNLFFYQLISNRKLSIRHCINKVIHFGCFTRNALSYFLMEKIIKENLVLAAYHSCSFLFIHQNKALNDKFNQLGRLIFRQHLRISFSQFWEVELIQVKHKLFSWIEANCNELEKQRIWFMSQHT